VAGAMLAGAQAISMMAPVYFAPGPRYEVTQARPASSSAPQRLANVTASAPTIGAKAAHGARGRICRAWRSRRSRSSR